MLTMIAAINEFERQNLLDRQREGIAIAKRNGVYKGRKKVAMPDNFSLLYERYTRRELNKGQLAELLHVTRPTLERMIREYLSTKPGRKFKSAFVNPTNGTYRVPSYAKRTH